MCIEPTEEDLITIHHELGHDFYFQRYYKLPILFQRGANDGFHEAIGDTMRPQRHARVPEDASACSTPCRKGEHARINQQMKMALDKVAFLPFGLLIDKWRWDVFAGKIAARRLQRRRGGRSKQKYQGVAPPVARTADDFDPGAKYHVARSIAVRPLLPRAHLPVPVPPRALQGGGLHGAARPVLDLRQQGRRARSSWRCSRWARASPWPDAMEAVGAGRKADAGRMLEYFAPLRSWLKDQNKGQQCGW